MNEGKIIIYQAPDGTSHLEVRLEEDTVWLDQYQMAELFNTDRTSVLRHIRNIYATEELEESSTCAKIAQVQMARIPFWNIWVTRGSKNTRLNFIIWM
jgi:hypothetical protein